MKVIKLIFHVGRQKTATSFIQKHTEKIENIYFIGKKLISNKSRWDRLIYDMKHTYGNKNYDKEFEGKINEIHNQIVKSYRGEIIGRYPNNSSNNYPLIEEYCDEIIKIFDKNINNYNHYVISDENISDYLNYNGELNLSLFISLGNLIERKLKDRYIIEKNISMTIRNQVHIIHSLYCYNSFYNGGIKKFLDDEFQNKFSNFSGSLFYYHCYCFIESLCDKNWKINFIPYEILSIDKRADLFLSKVLSIENSNLTGMFKNSYSEPVNNNSVELDRNIKIKRIGSFFYRFGHILSSGYKHSFIVANNKNYFAKYYFFMLITVGNFLILFHFLLRRIGILKREKKVEMDVESKKIIKKTYKEDNLKLNKLLKDYDLNEYGYL